MKWLSLDYIFRNQFYQMQGYITATYNVSICLYLTPDYILYPINYSVKVAGAPLVKITFHYNPPHALLWHQLGCIYCISHPKKFKKVQKVQKEIRAENKKNLQFTIETILRWRRGESGFSCFPQIQMT